MVLFHRGGGHSTEAAQEDYWTFVTAGEVIFADIDLLISRTTVDRAINMTRSISFQGDPQSAPSAETVACIKEALCERGRRHMFDLEAYARCDFKPIDARTHQELGRRESQSTLIQRPDV
jgi:hypothetical protein